MTGDHAATLNKQIEPHGQYRRGLYSYRHTGAHDQAYRGAAAIDVAPSWPLALQC